MSTENLKELAFCLGRPLGPLYGLAMRGRELGYQKGLLKSHKLPVPVISVGNLLMGGTGKTPIAQYLARLFLEQGRHPAIISRGYGGRAKDAVNVVSDGEKLLLPAELAGDEPRLLAETLPGVMVLTGRKRILPAERAVEMGADLLVLDDGFQHMAVQRDMNLVLFNADRLSGNGRICPGGELREGFSALARATSFVLTGMNEKNRVQAREFAAKLQGQFPGRPVYTASCELAGVLRLTPGGTNAVLSLDEVRPACMGGVFAFCGIAEPANFFSTIAAHSFHLRGVCALADHQHYRAPHLAALCDKARQCGATALMTTAKDLVKLAPLVHMGAQLPLPLFCLDMRAQPEEAFARDMLRILA